MPAGRSATGCPRLSLTLRTNLSCNVSTDAVGRYVPFCQSRFPNAPSYHQTVVPNDPVGRHVQVVYCRFPTPRPTIKPSCRTIPADGTFHFANPDSLTSSYNHQIIVAYGCRDVAYNVSTDAVWRNMSCWSAPIATDIKARSCRTGGPVFPSGGRESPHQNRTVAPRKACRPACGK
jgi:hypothetical protein